VADTLSGVKIEVLKDPMSWRDDGTGSDMIIFQARSIVQKDPTLVKIGNSNKPRRVQCGKARKVGFSVKLVPII
jgi:hypothetical protein